MLAGEPYLSLMYFDDVLEREKILGPLHATAVKASAPIFGPERFITKSVVDSLNYEVQMALDSSKDPVVDLLAPPAPPEPPVISAIAHGSSAAEREANEWLCTPLAPKEVKQLQKPEIESSKSTNAKPLLSRRERFDQEHYTVISLAPTSKSARDQLDNFMLRRVIDDYLFDPGLNQKAVADDSRLQDVWKWIAGKP